MDFVVKFTNHKGHSMIFGVEDGELHYFANDLRDYEWAYTEFGGLVSSFNREIIEREFKIGIAADTEERGLELRNQLAIIGDEDILAGKRGTLTIGDYSLTCAILGQSNELWHMSDRFMETTLKLIIERPVWLKAKQFQFRMETTPQASDFLDYDYDYDYDYTRPRPAKSVYNNAMAASDFMLRIYGPCTNPYVQIAGNSYQVNTAVPAGSMLEIDSRVTERTIVIKDAYGNQTNAFDYRARGTQGSGSYIFEKIPAGQCSVAWGNTFDFDLVLYDERSIPEWS